LPKTVEPCGWVTTNGVSGKSVRISATLKRSIVGGIDGSAYGDPGIGL
jgi:hypothetical protein